MKKYFALALLFTIFLFSCGKKEANVTDMKKEAPKTETTTPQSSGLKLPADFPLEVAAFKTGNINSSSESGDIKSVDFKPDGFPEDIAEQVDKELTGKGFKKTDDDKDSDRMKYGWAADKKKVSLYIYLKNGAKSSVFVSYQGFK